MRIKVENWPFRELVGSSMWLSISTRPDIANAVRAVARYTVQRREPSTRGQLLASWSTLMGLVSTVLYFREGLCLVFSLEVFENADYASKATDRRSISGGLIMCGGASVCWFSRTQKCVTLSTSEAEYAALGDAVKELSFLRQVWRFMLPSKVMPYFPVFEDNQGAVQLAQNPSTN